MIHPFLQGFYPYPIPDEDKIVPPIDFSQVVEVTGLSLATLIKLWWAAKSFDITYDISYNVTASDYTESGTITGDGTANVLGCDGDDPSYTGYQLAILPTQRCQDGYNIPSVNEPFVYGLPVGWAATAGSVPNGTLNNISAYIPPIPGFGGPNSSPTGLSLTWFTQREGTPQGYIYRRTGGGFGTLLGAQCECGSAGTLVPGGYDVLTSANLRISAPGEADILVPLGSSDSIFTPGEGAPPGDYSGLSVTGEIHLDFNSFYT